MFFESYKSILFSDTLIPDIFITEYMSSMDGDITKIYIYCLFLSKYHKTSTNEELASKLGLDISKVKSALTYLENIGLISIKDGRITLTDLKEREIKKIYRLKTTSTPNEALLSGDRNKKRNNIIMEINNTFFQGVMAPSWYTDLDAWFDRYQFDEDVMYALFNHCKSNKGLSKQYVSVVAESWHNKGIKNHLDLDKYSDEYQKFKDIRGKIHKKLKRKVPLTEYEEICVEKWVTSYKYSFEIIEVALKKTISKPEASFKYIDTIITDWHNKGLRTLEEILVYDASKKGTSTKNSKEATTTPQRGNFEQRQYDDAFYDSLYKNVKKTKTI